MKLALLRAQPYPPTAGCIWLKALRTISFGIRYIGAVIFMAALSFAVNASGTVTTLRTPGILSIERADDGTPVIVDSTGGRYLVRLVDGKIVLQPTRPLPDASLPKGALPDAEIATSSSGDRAWLGAPTDRYGHGVLGDAIEAGALLVKLTDGTTHTLTLDDDAVFEDRYPRFADMDGDGDQEILLVKSYQNAGGALVLVDPSALPLSITAEAPSIGTPNRWLNPAGAGDVDGDGRAEVLVVITPHIGGTLTAYEWRGDRLVVDHTIYGFSNHAIGSRELALSAVEDLDGDGVAEVIVPDASRRAMTIVRFNGVEPKVVAKVSPAGRVAHRLVVHDLDGDGRPELTWGSNDGTVVVWQPGL